MVTTKGAGRPLKDESDKLSKQHPLKVTAAEKEEFVKFSLALSLSVSAFLRMASRLYMLSPPAYTAKPKSSHAAQGDSSRQRGAPRKPDEAKCNVPSPIAMTPEEHAEFTAFAKSHKMTLSGFFRQAGHYFISKHAGKGV